MKTLRHTKQLYFFRYFLALVLHALTVISLRRNKVSKSDANSLSPLAYPIHK